MTIILKSDNEITAKGFKGEFKKSCGGRIVVEDSGEIQFRDRDKNSCVWSIIAADPTKKVLLTFTKVMSKMMFMNETHSLCVEDIVVYEGDSDEGPVRARICDYETVSPIYSNGNALTIEGNFNESEREAVEFSAHFSVLENGENGQI
jgi:hypothetical protein